MPETAPSTDTLNQDTPVDAALRRLAKLYEEVLSTPTLDPQEQDMRLIYGVAQQFCLRMAKWTRQVTEPFQGRFTAAHLIFALTMIARARFGDDPSRQFQREVYADMVRRMHGMGLTSARIEAPNPFAPIAMWAMLQSRAMRAAMAIQEPKVRSREAIDEYLRARALAMTTREQFIEDLSEMAVTCAAMTMGLVHQKGEPQGEPQGEAAAAG